MKCSSCPVKREWFAQSHTDTDPVWFKPTKLTEAFDIYQSNSTANVKFVSGNTGKG